MVSNNLGSNNKKIIAIIIALFVIIVGLIIGVVIVNNSRKKIDEEEYAEYLEKVEMDNLGIEDCEQIQNAYDGGAIKRAASDTLYENLYNNNENDDYRIYLTICYADYIYDKEADLDGAVELVEKIKPLIKTIDDEASYYNAMAYYYYWSGDEEKSEYYQQLSDDLMSAYEEVIEEGEE